MFHTYYRNCYNYISAKIHQQKFRPWRYHLFSENVKVGLVLHQNWFILIYYVTTEIFRNAKNISAFLLEVKNLVTIQ